MDEKTRQKLEHILKKESLRRAVEDEKTKQKEDAARVREEKHQAALKSWYTGRSHLTTAVKSVNENENMLASGLSLAVKQGSKPDKEMIDCVIIELVPKSRSFARSLIVNVDHIGVVRPMVSNTSTAATPQNAFAADEANPDLFSGIITDYIEQALANE
jgi:hypothetical protein